MPRFYCPIPLATGLPLSLPAGAARHVQVLRLQPGDAIRLFNGEGGEFDATVTRMGRSDVDVEVGAHHAVEREAARAVHLLAGITANERMDWLVEKATELGVASITPLVAERSVLKLKGERAEKKLAHWQGVAVAAAEQCGRNRVPTVHAAVTLAEWVKQAPPGERWVLSLSEGTQPLAQMQGPATGLPMAPVTVLSGPEGGLSPTEEATALAAGFAPVTLGPRVLRAETAPLAVLACCA
jgi:16S rRNA (uracil1498-N3)-methyltransferase